MNRLRALGIYALGILLAVDCLANMLARGSFHETLSARAHRLREQKHRAWGWTAGFVDALFFWQDGHCKTQFKREQKHGGAWGALHAWAQGASNA
jgi:hypothetical protein